MRKFSMLLLAVLVLTMAGCAERSVAVKAKGQVVVGAEVGNR